MQRWYVLSATSGIATLCATEAEAMREAIKYDQIYPKHAPHFATRIKALDDPLKLRADA